MHKVVKKKYLVAFSLSFVSLSLLLVLSLFISKSIEPTKVRAATLTNASALLSNPRLSYRALATAGISGTSSVTISSSNSYPDHNTFHLFPGDPICFANGALSGCLGNIGYTVATVSGDYSFSTSTTLSTNVNSGTDLVIATQSGNLTLTFTLVSAIPSGGSIFLQIPVASSGNVNDGFPDTGTSLTASGFDFNRLTPTSVNISSTGGTCADGWNTPVVASASGTITITKATSSCAGATVTIVIPNLVNPAPITGTTPHVQGTADYYRIGIITKDGSGGVLDLTNVIVAPIEGVLVSAIVDQTLSFTVAGIASGQTVCGASTSVQTQAYSVPWGTIGTANVFRNAAQILTVGTNASNGYYVTVEENDQMGLNGNVCTGATPAADGFTFSAGKCIRDTVCDSGCTETTAANWTTATNNGLGYSLENVGGGTDAAFTSGASFSAKQLPDQETTGPTEAKQTIMSNAAPVSASQANVCYRISVSGTQPAGYYYNKVKYTATARF